MAKNDKVVESKVVDSKATENAVTSAEPASVAAPTPLNGSPMLDGFLAVLMDPERRAAAVQKLDAEIAQLETRLTDLKGARGSLAGPPAQVPAKRSGRPARSDASKAPSSEGKRPGRPSGVGSRGHKDAITAVLRGKKNGLTLAEIYDTLQSNKHDIPKKTVSTYLSNMQKAEEVASKGDQGAYRYSLTG